MEKASRALRRSGAKLLSLGGNHGDLTVLLSDLKELKNTAKSLMNSHSLCTQDMMKWASHQDNRAVQDVVSQIGELQFMWVEVQKAFLNNLRDYRQVFEMILEGEKKVTQAKENLEYCEQKEQRARKDMKKAVKRDSSTERRILESRLALAEDSRNMAQIEVSDSVRENESVKLIRLKEGFVKVSTAYMELGNKCSSLHLAQRDVAEQLPDVHGQELERIRYTGAERVRAIVQHARERVQGYTESHYASTNDDPPPPYMPPGPNSQYDQPPTTQPKRGSAGQLNKAPRRYSEPLQRRQSPNSEEALSKMTITNIVTVRQEKNSSDSSLSRSSSANLSEVGGERSDSPCMMAAASQGSVHSSSSQLHATPQCVAEVRPVPMPRKKHDVPDELYDTAEEEDGGFSGSGPSNRS